MVHCVASVSNETCETRGRLGARRQQAIGRMGRCGQCGRLLYHSVGSVVVELYRSQTALLGCSSVGDGTAIPSPPTSAPKHSIAHNVTLGGGCLLLLGASRRYLCVFAPARSQSLRDSSSGSMPKSGQKSSEMEPGVVAHTFSPSSWEAEAGRPFPIVEF